MLLDRGRNLLFGIFAVPLKKVTPTQIMDVAWAVDASRGLAERLVEAGIITAGDRDFLNGVVDQAVGAHEGDATAAMEAFGDEEQVHQTFRGAIGLTESGGVSRVEESVQELGLDDLDEVSAVQETPGR